MKRWRPGHVPAGVPPVDRRVVDTQDVRDGSALIRRLIRRGGRWLVPTSLGSILISGLSLAVPLAVGAAIDAGLVNRDVVRALVWCLAILGLYGGRCVATAMRLSGDVGANVVEHDLRLAIVERLVDPRGFGGPPRLPGDLVSVASTDVSAASRGMTTITSIPGHVITVVGAVVALAVLDPRLAAIVIVSVPIITTVSLYGIRPIRPYTRTERTAEAAAAGVAADLVEGLRTVQGLRAGPQAVRRFAAVGDRALTATLRTRVVRGWYTALVSVVVGLFIAALTAAAAYLGLAGQISVGDVAAVAGLAQTMGPPLRSIGVDTAAVFSASQASADRVVGVLETPHALVEGARDQLPSATHLRLRGVTVLGRLDHPVDLDFDLAGGRHRAVAVVAPGPVAETLADLLARRRSPDSGALLWGDVDLSTVSIQTHRRVVLVPPHRVDLFDGTLRSNITGAPATDERIGGNSGPDPARLAAVVAATACDEIARTQRDGLDTRIGAEGRALSGGQRQRLALARALFRPADLLVLDEPTTSVDAVTTAHIAKRLAQVRDGRPTLLLTTSPGFLAIASEVVQLNAHGQVMHRGRHEDLLGHAEYVAALA